MFGGHPIMLEDLFMSAGFLLSCHGDGRCEWLVGITVVLLAWLTVSSRNRVSS